MSNAYLWSAWMTKTGKQLDKLVLVSLADQANDDGICWPSRMTLARRCECSDRSISSALRRIEASSLVRTKKRTGSSNVYELLIPRGGPLKELQGGPEGASGGVLKELQGGLETASSGRTNKNPKTNPKEQRDLPESLSKSAEFVEAWDGWVEDRKVRGVKMTPKAWNLQLAKCEAWGPEKAIRAIQQSIENAWRGLFEPKVNGSGAISNSDGARPSTVFEMTKQLELIRSRMKEVRHKGFSEYACGGSWSNKDLLKEWSELKRRADELERRIIAR